MIVLSEENCCVKLYAQRMVSIREEVTREIVHHQRDNMDKTLAFSVKLDKCVGQINRDNWL